MFPLKLALRVLEISLFIVLATIITLAIVSFSLASQPMVMPEAQSMTYKEFFADREQALAPYDSEMQKFTSLNLSVAKAFFTSIPATI